MKIDWDRDNYKKQIKNLKNKRNNYLCQTKNINLGTEIRRLNHIIKSLENTVTAYIFLEKLQTNDRIDLHGYTVAEAEYILFSFFEICDNIPEKMVIITGKGTYRLYNWLEKNLQFILEECGFTNYNINYSQDVGRFHIVF